MALSDSLLKTGETDRRDCQLLVRESLFDYARIKHKDRMGAYFQNGLAAPRYSGHYPA